LDALTVQTDLLQEASRVLHTLSRLDITFQVMAIAL
jgi:hypothetical protein